MPVVIAWAAPTLVEFEEHQGLWWGLMFELLPDCSGFTAQNRHHGFCGMPAEVVAGGQAQIKGGRQNVTVMAVNSTRPPELKVHLEEILASFSEQAQQLGLRVG